MKKTSIAIMALAGCMLLAVPNTTLANPEIRDAWKAYYVDVCPELVTAANECRLCHTGPGAARNNYGGAIIGLDFAAIEGEDSDLDGYTNGQEIYVDCTLPGDATDHGTVADTQTSWSEIKALFR
jgi:hypothetical protein